jgi:cytochrome c oxidase subunit III
MAATITPIDSEREKKRRLEDHDHGSGRRPPNDNRDKRTGGGGEGDNWSNRPAGRRGPREKLSRYRVAIFLFLVSDFIFFAALVTVFFGTQSGGHVDAYNHYVNEWVSTTIPPILWLNTAVLLISSLAMELARRRMFEEEHAMEEWLGIGRPTSQRAIPWLAITIFLGTLFLVGQAIAWKQLSAQHVFYVSSQSAHFFYLITYTHAAHLFGGLGILLAALCGLYASRLLENRQILVDCAAWFWHSMGVFWIFLFTILVFFQ